MIRKLVFIICIIVSCTIYTQETNDNAMKSVLEDSYIDIFKKIKTSKDITEQRFYLNAFLNKAQGEKNWKQIVNGYKNFLHRAPEKLKIVYADSMIYTAINSKDTLLMSSSFLTKGIVYYSQKNYDKALDNYIIANNCLANAKTEAPYLEYKIKYNIAHIKYYLEQYDKALALLNECLYYFKEHNDHRAYLNTLHYIGLCHNRMFNYGSCSKINKFGIEEGKRLGDRSMEVYFRDSEGVNQYFKENYNAAIDSLKGVITGIKVLNDFANVTLAQFYLGKSYWALGRSKEAVYYLKMVDQSFSISEYVKPELHEAFLILRDYYKSTNDLKKHLYYLNRLIEIDSVLITRNTHLFSKVNSDYSIANLSREKQQTESLLEIKRREEIFWILGSSLLLILLLWYFFQNYYNKKTYRKKFEELMNKKAGASSVIKVEKDYKKGKISDKVEKSIINQLEKFEVDHKYLGKNLTRSSLAASFNTNTSYLSKIIKQEKNKKFSNYVNELKVDYVIDLLKENKIYRKYTIKALAEEVGFSSMQRFVKSFKAKTGMPPSYFIKELINETSDKS